MPKTFSCMTRATLSLHESTLCESDKVSTFFKALNEKKWEQVQTQAEELIQILKKSSIELNPEQCKLLLDHLTAYDVPQENQHKMALLMRGFCVRQMSSAYLEKDFCQTFKTWFQIAQENLKSHHPQVYAECFILQGIVEANEEVIEAKSPAPILAGLEKIVQGMHQFSWKLDKEQRQQLPKLVRLLFYKYTLLEEFKNAKDHPKFKAKLNIKLIERTRKIFEEENLENPSSSESKADSHYRETKKTG